MFRLTASILPANSNPIDRIIIIAGIIVPAILAGAIILMLSSRLALLHEDSARLESQVHSLEAKVDGETQALRDEIARGCVGLSR